jgi:hypothetical protein
MRQDDTVLSEVLNHLLGLPTCIQHHEVRVGVDGAEHARIDLIQELLTIIRISLHTDPDMLGIAECGCGSPCRDNVDAKGQSPSSQQARRVRSGNPISDA